MPATVTYYAWHAPIGSDERHHTLEIRYTRREYGGWLIRRADNGRLLGWAVKSTDGREWHGYIADDPFRGDDVNDEGYYLDDVPGYLTKRGDGWHTITGDTRAEVAETIISCLCREKAPALGFGRHYQVTRRYADRPHLREYFKNGMQGEWPSEEN